MGSPLTGKRILVTGSSGVIGRELLTLLANTDAEILSVDRSPLPTVLGERVQHLQRDIVADPLEALGRFRPHCFFHLAAAFERSKESPAFWNTNWQDNVVLSHRLLEAVKACDELAVLVFASSYLVYSPAQYLFPDARPHAVRLPEQGTVTPRNLCGAAKYYTEQEIDFVKAYFRPSLRTVHARIFRVYGCGSRDVISRWVRAGLDGQPIEMYNSQNRFDFIFARDVAEGLMKLAECPQAKGAVNIGTGSSRSIHEMAALLSEQLPVIRSLIRDTGQREDIEASCADTTNLAALTGWTPPTTLEKGLGALVEFERQPRL